MLDEGPASARDAARCSSWHAEIRIRIRIRFRIRIRSSGRQARVGFGIFCSIQHRQAHIFSIRSRQACLGHAGDGGGALGSDSGEANLEAQYWYNELLRFKQSLRDSLTVASCCTRARMVQLKKLDAEMFSGLAILPGCQGVDIDMVGGVHVAAMRAHTLFPVLLSLGEPAAESMQLTIATVMLDLLDQCPEAVRKSTIEDRFPHGLQAVVTWCT